MKPTPVTQLVLKTRFLMFSGWRNAMKHTAFLASHVLFVVLSGVYLYECSSILRHAGLS